MKAFWIYAIAWTVIIAIVAVSILIRIWIAGPDCFWATDIGICQAIRDVRG